MVFDRKPRGYWRYVIAAFGWLTLTAQHPNPEAQSQQPKTDARVGDAFQNIATTYGQLAKEAKGSPLNSQCDPGDDHRYSDLCAQWKAADAAKEAAWWAKIGTWVSGFSGLLVLVALYAAFMSNWIARDTAKKQLRAYLTIKSAYIKDDPRDVIWIEILNSGQTPAFGVTVVSSSPLKKVNPETMALGMIGPQAVRYHAFPLGRDVQSFINYRELARFTIRYRSAFGQTYEIDVPFMLGKYDSISSKNWILQICAGDWDEREIKKA